MKVKVHEKGNVYKTSRFAYFHNYMLIGVVFIIILLILPYLNITGNILHFGILFGLLIVASALTEEPEWERIFRKYILTNNEVIKHDGFIRKKRFVMPFQSIADVQVSKGVVGRIFDFGTVDVVGFKDSLIMKGIKNPEEVQRIIQQKINMQRERMLKRFPAKQ